MNSSSTDDAAKKRTDQKQKEKEKEKEKETREAFFASLSPKDQLIHTLAVEMLKTRYTPERSNAWAAWIKEKK